MTTTQTDLETAFKAAFREHPAGVALITANTVEGPVGLTASSVASVAVDPATLVFSVTRSTGSAGLILGADSILVHLLDARHQAIAQEYAVSGGERFTDEQNWSELPTGEPHLGDVRVALRCRIVNKIAVGSSMLAVAEVLSAHTNESGAPMIYLDRAFRLTGDAI